MTRPKILKRGSQLIMLGGLGALACSQTERTFPSGGAGTGPGGSAGVGSGAGSSVGGSSGSGGSAGNGGSAGKGGSAGAGASSGAAGSAGMAGAGGAGAVGGSAGASGGAAGTAGQGGTSGAGGAAGTSGTGGSGGSCVGGGTCSLSGGCWESAVIECQNGSPVCVGTPKQAGSPCAGSGVCTGDGGCISPAVSCAGSGTPGCGQITVRGGAFTLGQTGAINAVPVQPNQRVGDFVVDAYEVTVARFRAFWDAGFPSLVAPVPYPGGYFATPLSTTAQPATTTTYDEANWSLAPAGREDHPINRLSWDTAMAFCVWDGGRLPTELEWEYVARHRQVDGSLPGRTYPWGEELPDCGRTQWGGCGAPTTGPVGSKPGVGGVFDLAGNVREWTADAYQDYTAECWAGVESLNFTCQRPLPRKVPRGSYFKGLDEVHFRSAHRFAYETVGTTIGMRCVRDLLE